MGTGSEAYAWGREFVGRDQLIPSRMAQPEGTPHATAGVRRKPGEGSRLCGPCRSCVFPVQVASCTGQCEGWGGDGLRGTRDPLRPIGSPAAPVGTPCPIAPSAAERVRSKKMNYGHKTEHRPTGACTGGAAHLTWTLQPMHRSQKTHALPGEASPVHTGADHTSPATPGRAQALAAPRLDPHHQPRLRLKATWVLRWQEDRDALRGLRTSLAGTLR